MAETKKSTPLFADFLLAQAGKEGCWEWYGSRRGGRHGKWYSGVTVSGKQWYAHRLTYAIYNGDLVDGLQIDHLCRNTRCVNPSHLEQVEGIENWKRGESVTRMKQLQTHCRNGHEFTPENTYIHRRKGRKNARDCRTCVLIAQKAYFASHPEKVIEMNTRAAKRYATNPAFRERSLARSKEWKRRKRAERAAI